MLYAKIFDEWICLSDKDNCTINGWDIEFWLIDTQAFKISNNPDFLTVSYDDKTFHIHISNIILVD